MLRDYDLQLLHSLKHSIGADLPAIRRLVELLFQNAEAFPKGKAPLVKCKPAMCKKGNPTSAACDKESHACASRTGRGTGKQAQDLCKVESRQTHGMPCTSEGDGEERCAQSNSRKRREAPGAAVSGELPSEDPVTDAASCSKRRKQRSQPAVQKSQIVVRSTSAALATQH
jgi:hypothetical protein